MRKFIVISLLALLGCSVNGQDFAYGIKGGGLITFQNWNGVDRTVLPRYTVSAFIESLPVEGKFSLFGQFGYYVKGSSIRTWRLRSGNNVERINLATEFKNLSLILGGKSGRVLNAAGLKAYYLFGIRGDYNIKATSEQFLPYTNEDINKFVYGFSFGGGIEYPLAERIGMLLELQIHPDARPIIDVPEGKYVFFDQTGTQRPYPATRVFNVAMEVTVGFRFLRKVEYVDEEY